MVVWEILYLHENNWWCSYPYKLFWAPILFSNVCTASNASAIQYLQSDKDGSKRGVENQETVNRRQQREREWDDGRWRIFYRISQPVWRNWWKPASKLLVSSPTSSHVSSLSNQLRCRPDISLCLLEEFPRFLLSVIFLWPVLSCSLI